MAMGELILHDIFMDLQKAYDALDWDKCLEILVVYGVGPRAFRILQTYWGQINIVAKHRGYYYPPLNGYRGVAQGDPLPPTIFNVVVYAVIGHCVMMVAAMEEGSEGLGTSVKDLVAYFYEDNRLVMSNQLERMKRLCGVLTDLFDRVGLRMNTWKTVSMEFQACHMPGSMSVMAYDRRLAGMGPTYRERNMIQVQFPECGVGVAAELLLTHCQSWHGMRWG